MTTCPTRTHHQAPHHLRVALEATPGRVPLVAVAVGPRSMTAAVGVVVEVVGIVPRRWLPLLPCPSLAHGVDAAAWV